MSLFVRRAKATDLPVLETLEIETMRRFPSRTRWLETYRHLVETAQRNEPDGLLVADYDGRPIGVALTRIGEPHPLSGLKQGHLEVLTVAPGWRSQGIAEKLIKEAEGFLKSRGCQVLVVTLPSDAGGDGELFKVAGFKVAAWQLERAL